MSEASVSRGWGSKNFACIEAFNARNQCVKHLWEESDKDDPDFEAKVYQMYLLYLSLITDTSLRWNFFSNRYEEVYVPVCLGGNKGVQYKIYEGGNHESRDRAVCTSQQPDTSRADIPERRPSRSERKRARRANYQKFMAKNKARG